MPSGITVSVYDGDLSLKKYLTNVARSLSDFIHMRDESMEAELRPRSVAVKDSYHEDRVKEETERLNALLALSEEDLRECYYAEMELRREKIAASIEQSNLLRERYDTMIARVEAMDFPEDISYGKDYALKYLEESKSHDVSNDPTKYHASPDEPFEDWCASTIKSIADTIQYCTKMAKGQKERERDFDSSSQIWIDFINSLED